MHIIVTNRVFVGGELDATTTRDLVEAFRYRNPDYAKAVMRARGKYTPREPEYLTTARKGKEGWSFPLGAYDRVCDILRANNLLRNAKQTHMSTKGDRALREYLDDKPFRFLPTPRDFQVKQVEVALAQRCTLFRAPPGSGKTTTLLKFIADANLPALVVVPSKKIFDQWIRRAVVELGLPEQEVGQIQGARRIVKPLTIAMAQTLTNHVDEYASTFGVFAGDEVHRHGAESFSSVTDHMKSHYRIGVSADERRADEKEFLIYDLFGPVRHEVTRQSMIDDGFIVDAEIRVVPSDLRLPWYDKLPAAARAQGKVQTRLATDISKDAARNELIARIMGWCLESGEATLVLAKRIEHCLELHARAVKTGTRAGLMLGAEDSDRSREFEASRLAMEAGTLRLAVGTYGAVGTGFDLPRLSRGVFAAPVANNEKGGMQFAQFCGRYERPCFETSKQQAVIYYVWDRHLYGARPLVNLTRWKPKVWVLDGDTWVGGKHFLKTFRQAAAAAEDDTLDGLFAR